MNLGDRVFLWAWGMAVLMLLLALAYPEKALEVREANPLWFGQLMATLIVGYPFYSIGQSAFNYFKNRKQKQEEAKSK